MAEERPQTLIKALKLKAGDKVADIGVGTGYFARRISRVISPKGTVYGVDIQQEMLDLLKRNLKNAGINNVEGVLGTIQNPNLPANTIDLALMVDVYHEFSHPYEMMQNICKSLKPGGRIAFVEYRMEDPNVPIKLLHKMSQLQVLKEATPHPLEWVETISVPFGTNRLTMATLSLSKPPPLPRRSSTNCSMPAESRRAIRALRTSPAEPRVNLDR